MGQVTRREWVWAGGFAAFVMALTSLPYLMAALTAAQTDWSFGGFLIGVEDGNSYMAKMGQGARGAWLFTLPYTSEPQPGAPLFAFHLLLGKLAGSGLSQTHAARVLVYHLARVVFGFGLLLISYRFLAEFLQDVPQRRWGLVLVALGGGLGWLLAILGLSQLFDSLPIDFYSPEAYSFLILFSLPHLAAARSLFLLGLLAYLKGRGVAAGLALLGASFIQPLSVMVAWAVILGHVILHWIMRFWPHFTSAVDSGLSPTLRGTARLPEGAVRGQAALPAILISSPFALYTVYLFSADPFLKQWNAQNVLPSAHPLHYVFGYGVWLIPAIVGWRVLSQRRLDLARFALGWALLFPLLIYAPIPTQRRLIEGFQLPLVALAVLGATQTLHRRWMVPLIVGVSLPTTAILLAGSLLAARIPAEPIFHPVDQLAAFDWLSQNAQSKQVVLGSFETGNALPAYTPLVAYIGHGPESLFLAEKLPRVAAFYRSSTRDTDRLSLLTDGRISFVIFGPHERALGDFDPKTANYLQRRFSSGEYAVYQMVP
jgi:hypothetical protein